MGCAQIYQQTPSITSHPFVINLWRVVHSVGIATSITQLIIQDLDVVASFHAAKDPIA